MNIETGFAGTEPEIRTLFRETFTASEGKKSGNVIAGFVSALMETSIHDDVIAFSAREDEKLLGCIFFSRMRYSDDPRSVFILSPVAVSPGMQKRGIGGELIRFGLTKLEQAGVDITLTYGDPAYYGRFGYQQIDIDFAQAPYPLSQPIGWLAQALGGEFSPLNGVPVCVEALGDPQLW
jgi:predicted N-acetyltransferase YhbS